MSKDALFDYTVKCNGKLVEKEDFGKIGAFVMQDDILIETLTPLESFKFAAKLRTSKTNEEIDEAA